MICLAAAQAGIPVVHYSATQIKRILTGSGRAPKSQMQRAIQRELALAAAARAARRGRRPGRGPVPLLSEGQAGCNAEAGSSEDEWRAGCSRTTTAPGSIHVTHCTETSHLITKITGQLVALHDDTLTLKIDAVRVRGADPRVHPAAVADAS